MSLYHSTRSRAEECSAKEAIRRGLAPDGGLFVSDELGSAKVDVDGLAELDYAAIARAVLGLLLPDYTADEIAACVNEAYTGTFASPEVTPVVPLTKAPGAAAGPHAHVLELYHGPTSAFKDVALQMLPRLMARAQASAGAGEKIMIVTAPSGDTGKAALAGFADAPGCGITVFYPEGKVSRVQELQMTTQAGANVAVAAVRGNFDDAQSAVKGIFADPPSPSAWPRRASCSRARTPSTSAGSCRRSCTTSPPMPSSCAQAPSRRAMRSSSACPRATSATCSPATTPRCWDSPSPSSWWRATRITCSSTFSPRASTTAIARFSPPHRPRWTSSSRQTWSACSTTSRTATASSSPTLWQTSPRPGVLRCLPSFLPRFRRRLPAAGRTRTRLPAPSPQAGTRTPI